MVSDQIEVQTGYVCHGDDPTLYGYAVVDLIFRNSASMFRRPQTTNPRNFWYTPSMKWEKLAHSLRNDRTKREAAAAMVNISTAGVIMESHEGVAATYSCDICREQGLECKVFRIRGHKTRNRCAYCHYSDRPLCNAFVDVPGRLASTEVDSATSEMPQGDAAPPNNIEYDAASVANGAEVITVPVTNHMEGVAAVTPNEMQQENVAPAHREELRGDDAQTPAGPQSVNVMEALPAAFTGSKHGLPHSILVDSSHIRYDFSFDQLMAQVKKEAMEYLQQENNVVVPAMMAQIKAQLWYEVREELRAEFKAELHNELCSMMSGH